MVLEPAFQMSHAPMARSLATSPWAPLVAVASQRQVLLYNTNTLDLVGVFPFPEGQPNVVRFSRDGRLLLAGGGRPAASGKVVVWDITTGERVFEVGKELDAVLAADISADHKRIALGGPQRVVRVYSTETGELQYELTKHTDWVLSVEFSPDGVLLATADRNGGLCVWEADTGHEYLTLAGHTAAVNAVAWRGDSNMLASASEDATLRLWEMENGTAVKNWNAKTPLLVARFHPRWPPRYLRPRPGHAHLESGRQTAHGNETDRRAGCERRLFRRIEVCDHGKLGRRCASLQRRQSRSCSAVWSPIRRRSPSDWPLLRKRCSRKPTRPRRSSRRNTKRKPKSLPLKLPLTAAQQKLAALKSDADKIAAEVKQINAARAASDAERTKAATSIQQIESAKPSVAEALRHLTEALGKLPNDAKLAAAQQALNEQLKVMETASTGLQTKDDRVDRGHHRHGCKTQGSQRAPRSGQQRSVAAAAEQVKSLEAQIQKLTAALDAAQKSGRPAEAELADANRAVARWQDEIAFRDQMAALQKDLDAARKVAADRQAELDKANQQLAAVQIDRESAQSKSR